MNTDKYLNLDLPKELGLENMPEGKREKRIAQMRGLLSSRLMNALRARLSEEEEEEANAIIDRDGDLMAFLEEQVPDAHRVMEQQIAIFNRDMLELRDDARDKKEVISLCFEELKPQLEAAKGQFESTEDFEKALMSPYIIGFIEGFFVAVASSRELPPTSYDLLEDVFVALAGDTTGDNMYRKVQIFSKEDGLGKDERNTARKSSGIGRREGKSYVDDDPSYMSTELYGLMNMHAVLPEETGIK